MLEDAAAAPVRSQADAAGLGVMTATDHSHRTPSFCGCVCSPCCCPRRSTDPYSVVLRRKKLPMGLLQEPDKVCLFSICDLCLWRDDVICCNQAPRLNADAAACCCDGRSYGIQTRSSRARAIGRFFPWKRERCVWHGVAGNTCAYRPRPRLFWCVSALATLFTLGVVLRSRVSSFRPTNNRWPK